MEKKTVLSGFGIVVADRGFVYVGHLEHDGEWCIITAAQNIRRWGTKRGLGELAKSGPTTDTVLDPVGTVRVPAHAVMHIIDSEATQWHTK